MRIDIGRENRAIVLMAFYEAARKPGPFIIEDVSKNTLEATIQVYIDNCEASGNYYTDFLFGCNISLDLAGPEMDLTAYINANGKSAALKAITGLDIQVLPDKPKLKGWAYLKDKYRF